MNENKGVFSIVKDKQYSKPKLYSFSSLIKSGLKKNTLKTKTKYLSNKGHIDSALIIIWSLVFLLILYNFAPSIFSHSKISKEDSVINQSTNYITDVNQPITPKAEPLERSINTVNGVLTWNAQTYANHLVPALKEVGILPLKTNKIYVYNSFWSKVVKWDTPSGLTEMSFKEEQLGNILVNYIKLYDLLPGNHNLKINRFNFDKNDNFTVEWSSTVQGSSDELTNDKINQMVNAHELDQASNNNLLKINSDFIKDLKNNHPTDSPVYEVFDQVPGVHFYTSSKSEMDGLLKKNPQLKSQGVTFMAAGANDPKAVPVFRFFNIKNGDHFYTISTEEANNIITDDKYGMNYEGVDFFEHLSKESDDIPVYRYFLPAKGVHFFTTKSSEANLLKLVDPNLKDEGVAFWTPANRDVQN